MKKSIVVIMAHCDDIELSAGATLAKYISNGYKGLYGVLSLCNSGWTVNEKDEGVYRPSQEVLPLRAKEGRAAAKVFKAEYWQSDLLENCYTRKDGTRIIPGFRGPATLDGRPLTPDEDLPEGELFSTAAGAGASFRENRIIREVTELLIRWEPELVIGQPIGNFNTDHFAASQIVALAWQEAVMKADIGPYWIPASRDKGEGGIRPFPPLGAEKFVDVTGFEETGLQALACHVSQGQALEPQQQHVRDKWAYWGSKAGATSAEGFIEVYSPS